MTDWDQVLAQYHNCGCGGNTCRRCTQNATALTQRGYDLDAPIEEYKPAPKKAKKKKRGGS